MNPFRRSSREDITDPRRGCFMPHSVHASCQIAQKWSHFATAGITAICSAELIFCPVDAGWTDRRRLRQQPQHPAATNAREAPRLPPVPVMRWRIGAVEERAHVTLNEVKGLRTPAGSSSRRFFASLRMTRGGFFNSPESRSRAGPQKPAQLPTGLGQAHSMTRRPFDSRAWLPIITRADN